MFVHCCKTSIKCSNQYQNSSKMTCRALHFVFKVGNRNETAKFYRDILGMKILRHEEFEEGCKATCNGPYDGKWSKTMVGYGPEDNHFVVELTYNYGIGTYKLGNDFLGIKIADPEAVTKAKASWPSSETVEMNASECVKVEAPGGYKFFLENKPSGRVDPVLECRLACTDLATSLDFWNGLLGLKVVSQNDKEAKLSFGEDQASLVLVSLDGKPIDHATAFGRIAFSCPAAELPSIESSVKASGKGSIITPFVSLDTPGKATVQVVILGDPDGHEICFVGDEAFRELSQVDPQANDLLNKAMEADKSAEWFAKKGKEKGAA